MKGMITLDNKCCNNKILEAPFLKEMMKVTYNMWRMGWDERNGGNISYLLYDDEVSKYIDTNKFTREIKLSFPVKELANKIFLVTGTGKYFKNVIDSPETNLGIVKVSENGNSIYVLWGYEDGSSPTSELPAHFMSHIERLKIDKSHRVVIHTHATNVITMTFVHELDEATFTKTLWKMCTECLVVFPDGVGILPWMVPGSDEIGRKTAEKMKEYRLVIWPYHGIFGTGSTVDEAFGLIETVEKAAEVYVKVHSCGQIKQELTDEQLKELAREFKVIVRDGILK
ncbi:rhamnulose-1-phosphate aldolase [Clostridium coskatii]|uniref:Rhamnulose-1-phosphate aldolase n=2 Tax=Clostridium coskatii TaxID=1705578 RepID=A0A166T2H1_9CLOT|nr:Rhamnulose-1-phosphate aldolase [Clostridium coskatii]OBR90860.1 rhamnulose-1-phosphate aldolase [Clostridium coskatii]